MATTAQKETSTSATTIKIKISEKYKEFKLMNGHEPASVFAFMKSLKMKEEQFFEHYSSFVDLESEIWDQMIHQVVQAIYNDSNYAEFTVREKLLSFYYTFLEVLKANRSYVLLELKDLKPGIKDEPALKKLKKSYLNFAHELMIEGNDTGEIPKRPFISDQYKKGFWIQFLFIINFWKKDTSKSFEKTDAAVEKSVNLSLDLVEKGPLDSMIDFAKFLYQNRG